VPPTALVAGVGPGIGESVARRFHEEGLAVALFARSSEFVDDLAADLGERALAVQTDVTDPDAVAEGITAVREAFGPVEAFVHNVSAPAGRPLDGATADSVAETWRRRALGGFLCLRELGADLDAVVVSGTNYASAGAPRQVEWGSAAAATKGLARSVAPDLGASVVYVEIATAVAPHDTGLVDAVTTDEVADVYWELLDREPGFYTHRIEP
jgi:NAD(P)-dependent dehydrogenase (short-subunit alcohol dehydrogenase family)